MSNATKRVLAMALKERLTRQRLDDITIQSLVDDAQVSRKTFYYHFQDVYALLEWIFVDEGRRILRDISDAEGWQQGLRNIFRYFEENRGMILNIYRPLKHEEDMLELHISRLVRPLLERIFEEQPDQEKVSQEDRKFILDLYAFGMIELFLRWVGNGMKPEGEKLMEQIDRIFSGSMASLIQRSLQNRKAE